MSTAMLDFEVTDVSGQRWATIGCPIDACIDEIIPVVVSEMAMGTTDSTGEPVTHTLRRDRDGCVLPGSAIVGEELRPGERVVVQPNIDAG